MSDDTTILWRPVGPVEMDLVRASGMREFPPRLPEQPIFYPVTSEQYAVRIAREWNVPASGEGFVLRFAVATGYLNRHRVHDAGGSAHQEYWIPAEEIGEFNAAIVGLIELVARFGSHGAPGDCSRP
jgi:hypothetical protein